MTPRVVSLVPSITETLLAWGVRPVGVTRFCEAPGVPTVGGTKNPDLAAISALAPDVVLMDEEENRAEDAEALIAAGVELVATAVRSVADVAAALRVLAGAVGVPAPPALEVPASVPDAGPEVFVPIWRRPWMTIGGATYGSTLLSVAGFRNVMASATHPYPEVGLAEVAARRPRWVLAPSEPYPFAEKHRAELEQVAPAVMVDGQDLFWWGARTPAALGRLTEMAAALRGG